LAIKPNLQWVYTPGAMEAIPNALIGVVRMVYTIF
jgi:carbohydrate-selective porin OprB